MKLEGCKAMKLGKLQGTVASERLRNAAGTAVECGPQHGKAEGLMENRQGEKQMRPQTDKTLCFVCQDVPPTHKATRGKESFNVCNGCARAIQTENDTRNRIKRALYHGDRLKIFEYTLGFDLTPTTIKIEKVS